MASESIENKKEEYEYLNRDEFSSENYKLQIKGVGHHISNSQLKSYLWSKGLKPHKIKLLPSITFVTFKSAEDRDKAIEILNGVEWKKRILEVRIAKGKSDPLLQKRALHSEPNGEDAKRTKTVIEDPDEAIKNSFIPLWKYTYAEQLNIKREGVVAILAKMRKVILEANVFLKKDLKETEERANGLTLACSCKNIVASPSICDYRNKSEFTIGMNLAGKNPVIGFRFGKYRAGTINVGLPSDLKIIPSKSKEVVASFQRFLDKFVCFNNAELNFCEYYDPIKNVGCLRQVLVRETVKGDILLLLDLMPKDLSDEQLELLCKLLKNWFVYNDENCLNICSLYIALRKNTSDPLNQSTLKLLHGQNYITERCCDLDFKISPNSFFQVNTKAAELLYLSIKDLALVDPSAKDTILLDVCCGTGTIGLCLAKYFDKVIGIELIPEAVDDARTNAVSNNVSNIQFHAGKAEDLIHDIVENLPVTSDITVILDPPRCGVHSSVINTLRKCSAIRRVIYVSCNLNATLENFRTFAQCPSRKISGDCFIPEIAIPFDLFPHSNHVEVVIVLKRYKLPI